MGRKASLGATLGLALTLALGSTPAAWAAALKIGYSDWPGWVAYQVAIEKGWFKEEGVDVEFEWFDYVPSMDAFSAGKLDGVGMTNGDALVVGLHRAHDTEVVPRERVGGVEVGGVAIRVAGLVPPTRLMEADAPIVMQP